MKTSLARQDFSERHDWARIVRGAPSVATWVFGVTSCMERLVAEGFKLNE